MNFSAPRALVAGVLAAAAGMAVGHLAAGLTRPEASPVLAVGSAVIDRTPTPLKEWAVRTLGTWDKPVLLGSVSLVTLLLAATAGLLARRRPLAGVALLVLLSAVAGAAALNRPAADGQYVLPSVVTAVVGCAVLLALLPARFRVPGRTTELSAYPSGMDTRRGFLLGTGTVAAASVGAAAFGQHLTGGDPSRDIRLPRAADPEPALPRGLETTYGDISPLRTPNRGFYRVDTALVVPRVKADTWELRIDGDVRRPYTLTYDDIRAMPLIERDITMTCVSNEVGGQYVGAARWLGVRVADLLRHAEVVDPGRPGRQVLSRSVDGFTVSTPLGALTDDRDALLAIGMNGAPLPATHGFPARLVTPGLYGFVGSTKWVTRLTVTTYDAARAYWTRRGWATDAPVKPSARIDTPASLASLPPGTVTIGGVAWAQRHGVVRVEVSIDDGPWRPATLGPDVGVDYWRQWVLKADLGGTGRHSIRARVTDGRGQVQNDERAPVFPSGSSGIQEVVVLVG
ncbi:molybdopterin-dependent oxidoreductase [Luteipulveratus sp. YIM 133132]|uniref:molybdopterin-dependent oxidoreductase n=1 Tax=Luteipulveratus flavus TaxID=3031728 RepID=UPI0023B06A84|nr:molybdopterin-dependent oxidoreductase [Luteipulveratus sp. YIM 133132]MDE9365323.1 molybdopterin-dependent oxidoreductase [Luteipulveratus sp. YIM 133132]